MKLATISANNYYGLPGNLARQLNGLDQVKNRSYAFGPVADGFETNVTVPNIAPDKLQVTIDEVLQYVFQKTFRTQKFNLKDHLKNDNSLYSYSAKFFQNYSDRIFYRYYQKVIMVNSQSVTKSLSSYPLPLYHLSPVFDSAKISQIRDDLNNGLSVLAFSSHYQKRDFIEPILQMLFEMRENMGITVNWIKANLAFQTARLWAKNLFYLI